MRPTALLPTLFLLPAALAAQAHPLVGDWAVDVPAGMRIQNDEAVPVMAKGTLTVVAEGDSLIATLKLEPHDDQPSRSPTRLAAKVTAGAVTFVSKSEAKMNMNGEETTHIAISTYTFESSGDTLKGTVAREIEGVDLSMGGPQPITGKRVK